MNGFTKRRRHLRVPVSPDEAATIEAGAHTAGLSIAEYLRRVGQGHTAGCILDYERVDELAKINADLGRLGGLLKMWLSNDERLAQFGGPDKMGPIINSVLTRIYKNQHRLRQTMKHVIQKGPEF